MYNYNYKLDNSFFFFNTFAVVFLVETYLQTATKYLKFIIKNNLNFKVLLNFQNN